MSRRPQQPIQAAQVACQKLAFDTPSHAKKTRLDTFEGARLGKTGFEAAAGVDLEPFQAVGYMEIPSGEVKYLLRPHAPRDGPFHLPF